MKRQQCLEKTLKTMTDLITRVWSRINLNCDQPLINYNDIPQEYSRIISKLQLLLSFLEQKTSPIYNIEEDKQKLKRSISKNNKYEQFINHLSRFDGKYQFFANSQYIDRDFQQKMKQITSHFQNIRNTIHRLTDNKYYWASSSFTDLLSKGLWDIQIRLHNQKGQQDKWREINNILVKLAYSSFDRIQNYRQLLSEETSKNIDKLIKQLRRSFEKSQQIIKKLNKYFKQSQYSSYDNLSFNLDFIQHKVQPLIKFIQEISSLSVIRQSNQNTSFVILSYEIVNEFRQLRKDYDLFTKIFNFARVIYQILNQAWIKFKIQPQDIIRKEEELINSIKSMKAISKHYDELIKECNIKDEEIKQMKQQKEQQIIKSCHNYGNVINPFNLFFNRQNSLVPGSKNEQNQSQSKYKEICKKYQQLQQKYSSIELQQKQLKIKFQSNQQRIIELQNIQTIATKIIKDEKYRYELKELKMNCQLIQSIFKFKEELYLKNSKIKNHHKQIEEFQNRINILEQLKKLSQQKNQFQKIPHESYQELRRKISQLIKQLSERQKVISILTLQQRQIKKINQELAQSQKNTRHLNNIFKIKEEQCVKTAKKAWQIEQELRIKNKKFEIVINKFKKMQQEIILLKQQVYSFRQSLNSIQKQFYKYQFKEQIILLQKSVKFNQDKQISKIKELQNQEIKILQQKLIETVANKNQVQKEKNRLQKIVQISQQRLNQQGRNKQIFCEEIELQKKQLQKLKEQNRNMKEIEGKLTRVQSQLIDTKSNCQKLLRLEKSKNAQIESLKDKINSTKRQLLIALEDTKKQKSAFQQNCRACLNDIQVLKKELVQQKKSVTTLNEQKRHQRERLQFLKKQNKQLTIQKQMKERQMEKHFYRIQQQLQTTKQQYNILLKEHDKKKPIKESLTEQELIALKRQYHELCHQRYGKIYRNIQQQLNTFSLLYVDQLFQGQTLQEHIQYKYRILIHLRSITKKTVQRTRMVYKLDLKNQTNFHEYIDDISNLICIVKTKNNTYLASYYSGVYRDVVMSDPGLLISINTNQSYVLKKPDSRSKSTHRGMVYDPFFIIFGNSQIRIRFQESTMFSNFGIPNSYFQNRNKKVNDFLSMGNNVRDADLVSYEIYEIIFEGEEREKEQSRTQY